jgi:hypothetical protein
MPQKGLKDSEQKATAIHCLLSRRGYKQWL